MKWETGIVVEVAAQNQVIVMTSQGKFVRVPFNKPVCVGQEIHYSINKRPALWKWSIAAVLFLAIASSAGQLYDIPGGDIPAYFITLDINPSIELAINSEQRVIAVEGLNNEGAQLLKKIKLVGRNFKQAVEMVEVQAEHDGYLKAGENEIVVTVSRDGVDGYQKIELNDYRGGSQLEQEIGDVIKETLATVYHVKMWRVPSEARDQVRETGLTPAKYIAIHLDYEQNFETARGDMSSSTSVEASIERNGDYHYFEFEVTRPVLTPVTITRTSKE